MAGLRHHDSPITLWLTADHLVLAGPAPQCTEVAAVDLACGDEEVWDLESAELSSFLTVLCAVCHRNTGLLPDPAGSQPS
jgi:hypothetical protein